ncbi:hypothetical protein ACIFOC_00436 [Leucobacter aridicollis]
MMRVMEGRYNFDSNARAIPIDAPEWSRRILAEVQGIFEAAAEEVTSKPSKSADSIVEDAQSKALARIADSTDETAKLLREFIPLVLAQKDLPQGARHLGKRAKSKASLKTIAITVGIIAGLTTAVTNAMDIYDWVAEHVVAGEEIDESLIDEALAGGSIHTLPWETKGEDDVAVVDV